MRFISLTDKKIPNIINLFSECHKLGCLMSVLCALFRVLISSHGKRLLSARRVRVRVIGLGFRV